MSINIKKRLTNTQALALIQDFPLIELGEMASAKKIEKHPLGVTTVCS